MQGLDFALYCIMTVYFGPKTSCTGGLEFITLKREDRRASVYRSLPRDGNNMPKQKVGLPTLTLLSLQPKHPPLDLRWDFRLIYFLA